MERSPYCIVYSIGTQFFLNSWKETPAPKVVQQGRSNAQCTFMYINGSIMCYGCTADIIYFNFDSSSNKVTMSG